MSVRVENGKRTMYQGEGKLVKIEREMKESSQKRGNKGKLIESRVRK